MIPQSILQKLAQLASSSTGPGYYLSIKEIPGRETGANAGSMKIESVSWGAAGPKFGGGRGVRTKKVSYHDVTMTKPADHASTLLALYAASGTHLEKAVLDIVGEKRRLYRITMREVIVTSFSIGRDEPDSFSLDFEEIGYAVG